MATNIVNRDVWLKERLALLDKEKKFTRARDDLSRSRRALPRVRVAADYVFDAPGGKQTLKDLFGDKQQLLIYHYMFANGWREGCKSCAFWIDGFEGLENHLAARDTSLVLVSSAPLAAFSDFKARMGWTLPWVSAAGSDFGRDYAVSFDPADLDAGKVDYNYRPTKLGSPEMPGLSVFQRDGDEVFHTYSTYSRGLDILNTTYNLLDLTPKGRDEDALPFTMDWLRRHDEYV